MSWTPGLPVVTQADMLEWEAWRRARKLELQRARRRRVRRFDYEADPTIAGVVDAVQRVHGRMPVSRVLDALICDWTRLLHEGKTSIPFEAD